MTEAEWLTSSEPERMRQFVCNNTSERKRLLHMVAWCRCSKLAARDQRSREAVDVAERLADGLASDQDFRSSGCGAFLVKAVPILLGYHYRTDHPQQAHLLRDVVGNPFRSAAVLNPSWLAWNDGAIRKMAQAIYDARAFDRLPLLADALEDAGCTDADILAHCRSGGEHVRGCWVVDLLLGKS